ncbi:hypothetical protein IGJ83_003305 [Enterococcus pernyi]|uniref:hypothetical protein n=1 Tax=unclassified Enterococcus TaxID=2608891 RepID=UPI003D2FA04B
MNIGNIAQWIAVVSKIVAIISAIIYPLIQEKRKRKSGTERLARREYALVYDVIMERKEKQSASTNLESFKQLEHYNSLLMIINDDVELTNISNKISYLLKNNSNFESSDNEVERLLNKLSKRYNIK